jgi:hypothetical protein
MRLMQTRDVRTWWADNIFLIIIFFSQFDQKPLKKIYIIFFTKVLGT